MGFSEFQQHGLNRHVSSRFGEYSEDETSDDEYLNEYVSLLTPRRGSPTPRDRWKAGTRKLLLARRFVSEVQGVVRYKKLNRMVR